jgi:hypothetical protein
VKKIFCNLLIDKTLQTDLTLQGNTIASPDLACPYYYILSNDEIRRPLRFKGPKEGWIFFGIASPHALHVLAEVIRQCSLERIAFIDNNPLQLGHLIRLIHWILKAKDRIEFLQSLFCGEITLDGQRALREIPMAPIGSIRGARQGQRDDNLAELEERFWGGFNLEIDRFLATYGREVTPRPDGLLTSQRAIGEIDQCILTVACGTRERYSQWPFTAGFGSGYLRNERIFGQLKETLVSVPISFIAEDFSTLAEPFLSAYRYHPIALWTSNLLDDWFSNRIDGIDKLRKSLVRVASQGEPYFPEIDIYLMQDERSSWDVPPALRACRGRRRSRLSTHTRTFREVSRRMIGEKRIEIVNVPTWIDQDGGTSKLSCTDYVLLTEVQQGHLESSYDTIFLHILVGHGTPVKRFLELVPLARNRARRLLILEHHRWSPDFWSRRGLITPKEIRAVLGQEREMLLINGDRPWPRNFLMVYDDSRT